MRKAVFCLAFFDLFARILAAQDKKIFVTGGSTDSRPIALSMSKYSHSPHYHAETAWQLLYHKLI